MNHLKVSFICLIAAFTVITSGCKRNHAVNESEARSLADKAIKSYCIGKTEDCINLEFSGATDSEGVWLVEYRSDRYLLAIAVGRDRATEISRFREDR